jgi:hypothetical protein
LVKLNVFKVKVEIVFCETTLLTLKLNTFNLLKKHPFKMLQNYQLILHVRYKIFNSGNAVVETLITTTFDDGIVGVIFF